MTAPTPSPSSPPTTTQIGPIAATVAFAISKGIALSRITQVTGLTFTDLIQPNARVPDQTMGALWHMLTDAFPDEALGLQMAKAAPFSFFGALTTVAGSVSTMRHGLEVMLRFGNVVSSGLRVEMVEGPIETTITMSHVLDDELYLRAPPEAALGIFARHQREVLGISDAIVRIELMHEPMAPTAVYTKAFGAPVRFGRARNAMVLRSDALDRPCAHGNRSVFSLLEGHLEALRHRLVGGVEPSELARIREVIRHNATQGEYRAEALAKRLGMSLRSLERLVRTRGTSIRRLLDETREVRARELLADPRLGVEEVASRVGYSAESAFRRAFKRWSGMSPTQFRRTRPTTGPCAKTRAPSHPPAAPQTGTPPSFDNRI